MKCDDLKKDNLCKKCSQKLNDLKLSCVFMLLDICVSVQTRSPCITLLTRKPASLSRAAYIIIPALRVRLDLKHKT